MHDQPKYKPFRGSDFFTDGRAMRPFVAGTVARGTLREATPFYTGKSGDEFVTEMPVEVTAAILERVAGYPDKAGELAQEALQAGVDPLEAIDRGFKPGMDVVGKRAEKYPMPLVG